jgi:arabinan endo-1,5-alpha-L-arabinosidase
MKLLTNLLMTAALALLAALPLTAKQRVSVHDPSVVYDQASRRYYVFGSHRDVAWSTDLQNWTRVTKGTEANKPFKVGVPWAMSSSTDAVSSDAFVTPAVTKVKKGGEEVDFIAFNAYEWSRQSAEGYDISGNLWAPDVIWNPTMQKWCMYMSVNGEKWLSSIVLLTADDIEGPYTYQGPVVISGFRNSYFDHKTDLDLVIGQQPAFPERYNRYMEWGKRWPNNIDPCAFYDEEGQLWLSYGSWSGGIWMLQLDESTGLRDYDVVYPSTGGDTDGVTSDPYFGTKIAGGYYVSGEGSYIEHIGDYYYLMVSYGGLGPNEGYEMRVFRSKRPDGPYVDSRGVNAIYDRYAMNYGKKSDTRGEKLLGAYNNWGEMTVGECAQGHNSLIAAPDGRNYLVYHTKFNNGTADHEVRTHQVFVNRDGWLVAAPFEYNGETVTDADISSVQPFTADQIAGNYSLLVHKYGMDYANYEEVTPVSIILTADGQVTGSRQGTWSLTEGTGYISIVLDGVTYNGVVISELMDYNNLRTISFTACAAATGVNIWGYKLYPSEPVDSWHKGMVAHYGFDDEALANTFDKTQQAKLLKNGNNTVPTLVQDGGWHTGNQVRVNFGENAKESYVQMPNPLSGQALSEGATISFWVKRAEAKNWDTLFGFLKGDARFYMTDNTYIGYNGGDGNWIDLNYPVDVITNNLEVAQWSLLTLVVAKTGLTLYVNGVEKPFAASRGSAEAFDYGRIVNLLASADEFYLGRGSFWGSAPAVFDDVIVYNRSLSADEAYSLYMMELQQFDFSLLQENPVEDWYKGMVAHYGFDGETLVNTFNEKQQARLLADGDNTAPVLVESGGQTTGSQVSLNFGANGNESYVKMPNPLMGRTLGDGATLSFWVKRADANAWDALFGFVKGDARIYMTGNCYVGYNGGDGYWIDLNHPNATISNDIVVDSWQLVTLVVSRQDIALYVNGVRKSFATCNGKMGDSNVTRLEDFEYGRIVDLLANADEFYLGRGSFWGSAKALFDDVIVYNRPLSADEAHSLYLMEFRHFDFASLKDLLPAPVPGDTNGNGIIDSVDLTTAVTHMLDGSYLEAVDLNGDNKVDILDIVRLIKLIGEQ